MSYTPTSRSFSIAATGGLVAALAAVLAGFHLYVALGPHVVDVIALGILALAAVVIAVAVWVMRDALRVHPYAFLVVHVLCYVVIVGSLACHALVAPAVASWGGLGWLAALWSIGLLVHCFASLRFSGFADADA